jgi:hypothetical protein
VAVARRSTLQLHIPLATSPGATSQHTGRVLLSRSNEPWVGRTRWTRALLVCALLLSTVIGGDSRLSPIVAGERPPASGGLALGPFPTVLHSTRANAFVDPRGQPLRLVGLNVVPVWRNHRGRTWSLESYRRIRAASFNLVRLVLYWDDFEPRRGEWDGLSLRALDIAVGRARAAGLYVILDMIHLTGPGGLGRVPTWARRGDSVTSVGQNGAGYLRMLARRYRNEAAVAAYDPVNEFHRWPLDQDSVMRAYRRLIAQIRGVDPGRIILVQPSYGDTSVAGNLAHLSNLGGGSNLVWSLHDYFAGGDDDGYDRNGGQAGAYTWDGRTGYQVPDPAALERHLLVHLDTAWAAGLPVWVGEFGIGAGAINRDRWIEDQVRLFNRYGLGRAWWQYAGPGPFSAINADGSWRPWMRLLSP